MSFEVQWDPGLYEKWQIYLGFPPWNIPPGITANTTSQEKKDIKIVKNMINLSNNNKE